MSVRGVRGAIDVAANEAGAILAATEALLAEMVAANGIRPDDLAAAFFSLTDDLDAAFPAQAARRLGWAHVPLMDMREVPVPGSLPRCLRVLLLWNCEREAGQIVHVYRGKAQSLRPDLAAGGQGEKEQRS